MCIMILVLVKEAFKMKTFKEYSKTNLNSIFKFDRRDKIIFSSKKDADLWLNRVKEELTKILKNDNILNKYFLDFNIKEEKDYWVIVKGNKILSGYYPNA